MNIQLSEVLSDITGVTGLAIVATAHKIARIVYQLLTTKEPYREECAEEADCKRREREMKQLARRAQKLGYTLKPVAEPAPAPSP
jgi:hypothetical protein